MNQMIFYLLPVCASTKADETPLRLLVPLPLPVLMLSFEDSKNSENKTVASGFRI